MSSEPDSPSSHESSDKSHSASQFCAPCCTMCARREESKSYCTTCHRYLCDRCDFAHKVMVCFTTHHIVSLDDVANVEELEKTVATTNLETMPIYDLDANVGGDMKTFLSDGKKNVEYLMKLSYQLKKSLEGLGRKHYDYIGYINDGHRQFEEHLRSQKDELIGLLEQQYMLQRRLVALYKEKIDFAVEDLIFKLSNVKLIFDDDGETASGLDFSQLLTNGYTNDFFQPLLVMAENHFGFEASASDISLSTWNFNVDDILVNGALATSVDNNLAPYDPFNLPIVSEPRKLKCYVNPDLSLATSDPDSPPNIVTHVSSMQIHKTFGQKGNGSGQFNSPHGFCLGFDEDIVVADSSNHRVQIFDKTGRFKSQFGMAGRHDGYLWHPRKVALLRRQRRYVICDRGYERSRMQIFTEDGKFFKKIYIQYIDIVAGIAVTENEDIVVVDSVTPTVFIIGQNDFLRSIDCTDFMEEPSDIAVVGKEFYICDFKAHSIVVVDEEGNCLRKFGSKRTTMFPNGIDVSEAGDVLVGDSHGNFFHIAVYTKEGVFVAEFRCPYIKVSRCCGLKITSDGRLVTVDKNYHHIIVLDTLYITPGLY